MPVDDLWYRRARDGKTGQRLPSKRYGRGKRWRARWPDPQTGESRTELFHKKADAERHEANMQADISRGQYVDPRAGKISFQRYAEQWRSGQLHRDSTLDMVERAFRRHINPILGSIQMTELRPSHIRGWVKDRAAELSPSTLRLFYSYIASMCTTAVQDKVIGSSPCVGIKLPDVQRADRFIPSPRQVHDVAGQLYSRYEVVPYLAAGCGLRAGEIFGLELEHIDFEHGEITVVQQLKRLGGQPPCLAEPKTKMSRRTVEMPQIVRQKLAEHVKRYPPPSVAMEDTTDPRKPERRPAQLLFTTSSGLPVTRSSWSPVWCSAVRRAGLPRGFGLHGLRHYFATLLIHAGASVKTVQLALGHSSPTTTLNTYAHEWPEAVDRTRSLVDAELNL